MFIGILDFKATKNKGYISRHKNSDIKTGERLVTDMEFHFIELPKFKKKRSELKGTFEQWIYFIKNAENLEVIPENVTDEGLKIAYTRAEQHNWSKAELEAYDKVSMREQDDRGRVTIAVKDTKKEMTKKFRKEKKEMEEEFRRKEEENTKALSRKEKEIAELKRKEKENAEKFLNFAKSLLKQGVSIKATAKATGLTVEVVKKLKNKK